MTEFWIFAYGLDIGIILGNYFSLGTKDYYRA